MRTAKILIDIEPQGKQLPFRYRGFTIKDKKTRSYEATLRNLLRSQFVDSPFTGPIALKVIFGVTRPPSVSIKKRPLPCVKPDLDNMIKSLDSCTGILWEDDNLICRIIAEKQYATRGFIEISVAEMIL